MNVQPPGSGFNLFGAGIAWRVVIADWCIEWISVSIVAACSFEPFATSEQRRRFGGGVSANDRPTLRRQAAVYCSRPRKARIETRTKMARLRRAK
jgi:hypothetical protein